MLGGYGYESCGRRATTRAMHAERQAGWRFGAGTGNGEGSSCSKGGRLAVEVGAGWVLVVPGTGVVAVWIVGGVA